jgi:LPXTG-site transpeptidase (sortase) family protein
MKSHMSARRIQLSNIPLAARAVCLYIVIGLGAWGVGSLVTPASAHIASLQNASSIVEDNPKKVAINSRQIISGKPVRFSIERLGIDLPVYDGTYDTSTQSWTLSTDAVYFATITTRPNDARGNTLIYGHNQPKVIGYMKDIQVGDIVVVTTENNHTFRYSYTKDAVVAPDFTSVLYEDSETPQLAVMTCEGVWSETRRLMYFQLEEVL